MRRLLLLCSILAIMVTVLAQINDENSLDTSSTPSITALRTCAEKNGISPKEYIFDLFKKSDIVILGERDHRDTVQYDFILDLLADPRFSEEIGHVYTEVGCYNRTADVNRLLQSSYLSDTVFMDSLFSYYRNKTDIFYAMWEKCNRVKFLRGLYDINRNSSKKITLGLTDCVFSWDDIHTVEDYKEYWESPANIYRDSVMCAHIAEMYARQTPLCGKRKALVITNQPHALNYSWIQKKSKRPYLRQGQWMKQTFGEENVKIVLLNWFDWEFFNGQNYPMIANGHWDAAFELMNCRPFGLDLKDTPYGETAFHLLPKHDRDLRWQDVADGLIYDAPLYDHVAAWGIEGILTKEFEEELVRRFELFSKGAQWPMSTREEIIDCNCVYHTFPASFKTKEEVKKILSEIIESNE